MGFLDGFISKSELSNTELEIKSFEKFIRELKNNENISEEIKQTITDFIKNEIIIDGSLNELNFNYEDFTFILNLYQKNSIESSFSDYLNIVSKLYDKIVRDKNNRTQRQLFYKTLRIGVKNDFTFLTLIINEYNSIFDIFERKELLLSFLENIPSSDMEYEYARKYLDYVIRARRFYVDEIQYFTRIITVCKAYYNTKFSKNTIEYLFIEDRRNAGIYDVSMEDIERIEQKILELKNELEEYSNLKEKHIERIESSVRNLNGSYKANIQKKFSIIDSTLNDYQNEVLKSKTELENYTEDSKKEMGKYLDSLVLNIEELKKELDIAMRTLVTGESTKITKDYKECVNLINDLMNSVNIDTTVQEKITKLGEILLRIVSIIQDKKDEVKDTNNNFENRNESSTTVNKYLDSSRPLKERLDSALANKKTNQIYHASVDKVVKELLNSNTVYLVGPSGCCKTYSVKQIAELLELPLYDFGFVTDEHETFKSYKDVNGKFVKNVFYEAYKNGGICFFDEIDNSESKALVELNRIIGGNGEYEAYLFPNGELVYPHPNLRIVVAGNTYGDGASEAYSTRERLDFGTIDRFQAVEYYYDTNLEKKVLENYPDVFEFCIAYRKALENIGYEYSLTTRRIFKIKKNLDSQCYSIEEIVYDFFISSLRIDVLENIRSYIYNNIGISSNNEYYKAFVDAITEKKNNKHTKVRR